MTAPLSTPASRDARVPEPSANIVRLRGRVTTGPDERSLPSGAVIITFRMSVAREPTAMTRDSKQTVDWVDCTAWGGRARRSVRRWSAGDVVEIEGALRRRFYRGSGGAVTRLEVEVLAGRLVSRATAPRRLPEADAASEGGAGG